jgi:hypothetical protein
MVLRLLLWLLDSHYALLLLLSLLGFHRAYARARCIRSRFVGVSRHRDTLLGHLIRVQ